MRARHAMKRVGLLLPLCGLLLAGSGIAGAAPDAPADWTLLIYLDADNDLEKPMMRNLEDMLAVGSSDRVQVIVLAARSPESTGLYTDAPVGGLPDWSTTKLLRIERGRLKELADWGSADMGDAATLKRFLESATADFPAKRYALVFGDQFFGGIRRLRRSFVLGGKRRGAGLRRRPRFGHPAVARLDFLAHLGRLSVGIE